MKSEKLLESPKRNGVSKVLFLQLLRNKYGPCKVATHFNNGKWTKHIDILEIWEKGEWWRLETANNRSILTSEIVLDYDPPKDATKEESLAGAKEIAVKLNNMGFQFKYYFSGSKGYHFHLQFPDLIFYNRNERENIRSTFINMFKCDLIKKSERTMIALENVPHWKTGNKKIEAVV